MGRVVRAPTVYRTIGLLALGHDYLHRALGCLLGVSNSEVDFVNTSVTLAGAFSAKVHIVVIGRCVVMDDRIDRRVAIAQTIGRLVLCDVIDGDLVIAWHNDAEDLHRQHFVIGRPEDRHVSTRARHTRRGVPIHDGDSYISGGSAIIYVAHTKLEPQPRIG